MATPAPLADDREIYQLVLAFLAESPCTSAFDELRREVEARGLLGTRPYTGAPQTYSADNGVGAARLRELLSHTLRMSHALEPAESRLSAPAWTLLGRDPRALLPPPPSSAPSTSTARTLHETAPSGPLAAPAATSQWSARARPALPPSRDVAVRGSISTATHMHVLAARELGRRLPQTLTKGTQHVASVRGHLNPAFCCAFDRTGERVATGSDDFNVKLWSSRTGVLQHVLRGHRGEITDLAISADNTQLASASNDGTIRLWRLRDGVPIAVLGSGDEVINAVDFSRAAARPWLLCVAFSKVSLWDPSDYEKFPLRLRLPPPRWPPPSAGIDTAHPTYTGAAGWQGVPVATAAGMSDGPPPPLACGCGALDDTGNYAAVGAAGWPHLFMWPLHDARAHLGGGDGGAPQRDSAGLAPVELRGHKAEVTTVAFSNRGDRLLSGSRDGTARLWYWRGRLRSVAGVLLESPAAVAAVRRAREARDARPPAVRVNMVAWACDDSRCFTAETLHKTTIAAPCLEAWVSVWHGRSGDCLHTLPFAAAEPCYFLRASPVDAGVVASAGYDSRLRLWNARTAALLGEFPVRDVREDAEEERADVLDGAFAPDGRIALTDFNGALHFYGACADARLELAPSEQFFASEVHELRWDVHGNAQDTTTEMQPHEGSRPVLCDAQLSPLDDAWQRQPETFVERPAGFDAEQVALERQARERQAIEEAEEGEAGAPALPPGGRRGTAAAAAAGSSSGAAGKRSVRPWWADAPGRRGGPAARGPPARNGPRGGGGASSSQLYRTGDELNAALNAAVGAASSDDDGVDDESDWSGLSGGARSRSDDDDDESGQSYESGDDGDELEVGGHALRGGGRRKQQARRIKRLRRGDEFGSSSEGWAASDDEDAARRRRRRRDDGDGGDARERRRRDRERRRGDDDDRDRRGGRRHGKRRASAAAAEKALAKRAAEERGEWVSDDEPTPGGAVVPTRRVRAPGAAWAWLLRTEPWPREEVPQVGDRVVYLRRGHEAALGQFPPPPGTSAPPFVALPSLPNAMDCEVVGVEPVPPAAGEPRYLKLKVTLRATVPPPPPPPTPPPLEQQQSRTSVARQRPPPPALRVTLRDRGARPQPAPFSPSAAAAAPAPAAATRRAPVITAAEPKEEAAAVEEWVVHVYAPEAEAPDYLVSAGRYARAVEDWRAAAAALAPSAAEASSSAAASSSSSAEGVAFRMAWRDHDGSFDFYSGRILGVAPESSAEDLWLSLRVRWDEEPATAPAAAEAEEAEAGGEAAAAEAEAEGEGEGAAAAPAAPAAAEEFDLVSPWEIELVGAPAHEPPTVGAAAAIGAELAVFAAQPEYSAALRPPPPPRGKKARKQRGVPLTLDIVVSRLASGYYRNHAAIVADALAILSNAAAGEDGRLARRLREPLLAVVAEADYERARWRALCQRLQALDERAARAEAAAAAAAVERGSRRRGGRLRADDGDDGGDDGEVGAAAAAPKRRRRVMEEEEEEDDDDDDEAPPPRRSRAAADGSSSDDVPLLSRPAARRATARRLVLRIQVDHEREEAVVIDGS